MFRAARAIGAVVAVLAVVLVGPVTGAGARQAPVKITYSGSYLFTDDYSSPAGSVQVTQTFTWSETSVTSSPGPRQLDVRKTLTVSGHLHEVDNPGQTIDCTYTAQPHAAQSAIKIDGFYFQPTIIQWDAQIPNALGKNVEAAGSGCPTDGGVLRSDNSHTAGATIDFPHDAQYSRFQAALDSNLFTPKGKLDYTVPYNVNETAGNSQESIHRQLKATLTVNGGSKVEPPGRRRLTKAELETKKIALEAILPAWDKAFVPCSVAAATAPLFGLGLPGAMVGAVIVPVAGSLCAVYMRAVYEEVNAANDPPRSDYYVLANARIAGKPPKLPSCNRWSGSVRKLCRRFESALLALVTAAQHSASVATAMATTIARESAAQKAGRTGAVSLQNRQLTKLLTQFSSARAAERRAGGAVAKILAAAKVPIGLSSAQVATAIDTMLGRLARLGLRRSRIAAVAPGVLKPHASNWRKALPRA